MSPARSIAHSTAVYNPRTVLLSGIVLAFTDAVATPLIRPTGRLFSFANTPPRRYTLYPNSVAPSVHEGTFFHLLFHGRIFVGRRTVRTTRTATDSDDVAHGGSNYVLAIWFSVHKCTLHRRSLPFAIKTNTASSEVPCGITTIRPHLLTPSRSNAIQAVPRPCDIPGPGKVLLSIQ